MKKYIYILLITSIGVCDIYDNLFSQGNQAMIEKEYEDAIQAYESILELEYENSNLYYNLGNAYYRLNYIGQSIWAYMNALRINPRDKDAKHNLAVAKAKSIDRIELPPTFFILKFYRYIKSYFTLSEWILFGSIFLLIQAILVFTFQIGFMQNKVLQIIFTLVIITTISIHGIVLDKYLQLKQENTAIIIANGVNAYSGPFYGNNTILFKINEGNIADISSSQNDWIEIILIDGKKGWVQSESVRYLQ